MKKIIEDKDLRVLRARRELMVSKLDLLDEKIECIENKLKKCVVCRELKKYDEFYGNVTKWDGLNNRCIECEKIRRNNNEK